MESELLHLQTALRKQRWNRLQSGKSGLKRCAEAPPSCSGIRKGNPGAGRMHMTHSYKCSRRRKSPNFSCRFLILTVRWSFISSTWSDCSRGPRGFLPFLPPVLPGIFKDGFCGPGASLEASERNIKSSQTKPPVAALAQWVHLTPRPGCCKATFPIAAMGSVSFGFLLRSLHEDMKSLFLPARECRKCRQDFREQYPLSFAFGNQQALQERHRAQGVTTVMAEVSGGGGCSELLPLLLPLF